jgi:hypothetical protein
MEALMSISVDLDLLKTFGQIAAPAGLAIGAFLYLGRDIVAKNIFPTLTRQHAYHIIIVLAFMAWTVALAGIASWTYVSTHTSGKSTPAEPVVTASLKNPPITLSQPAVPQSNPTNSCISPSDLQDKLYIYPNKQHISIIKQIIPAIAAQNDFASYKPGQEQGAPARAVFKFSAANTTRFGAPVDYLGLILGTTDTFGEYQSNCLNLKRANSLHVSARTDDNNVVFQVKAFSLTDKPFGDSCASLTTEPKPLSSEWTDINIPINSSEDPRDLTKIITPFVLIVYNNRMSNDVNIYIFAKYTIN